MSAGAIRLRATPDMDTGDCDLHNAVVAELVSALRDALQHITFDEEGDLDRDEFTSLVARMHAALDKAATP